MGPAVTDYWLNKLFFDLQQPALGAEWRVSRTDILDRYPLEPEVRDAILNDDLAALAPRANAYLLRFYLTICGLNDAEALQRFKSLGKQQVSHHG